MDNLGPPPQGVDILMSNSSGKLYVVNELLNFYQRKLCLMDRVQALNLAHHKFKEDEYVAALKLLNSLWEWKGLTPSSDNRFLYRNIRERRRVGKKTLIMATDIIDFLEVEDKNLDITSLQRNAKKSLLQCTRRRP